MLRKLAEGADAYPSMKDYCRHLIRRFDRDSDGIINFQELCEGLTNLNILISGAEKQGLMKKLDIDRDG